MSAAALARPETSCLHRHCGAPPVLGEKTLNGQSPRGPLLRSAMCLKRTPWAPRSSPRKHGSPTTLPRLEGEHERRHPVSRDGVQELAGRSTRTAALAHGQETADMPRAVRATTRMCFLRPAQDVFPLRVQRRTSFAGARQWGLADGSGAGSRNRTCSLIFTKRKKKTWSPGLSAG